jgi:hypothetical protein
VPERWLLIAARAAAPLARPLWADAAELAGAGQEVTLVLTDDAVLERITPGSSLPKAAERGVRVLLERGAVGRRGIGGRLAEAELIDEDELAGLLLDPELRTVWR